jgi:hypothetical protein
MWCWRGTRPQGPHVRPAQAQPQDGAVALVCSVIDPSHGNHGPGLCRQHDRRPTKRPTGISSARPSHRARAPPSQPAGLGKPADVCPCRRHGEEQLPQLGSRGSACGSSHKGAHVFQGTHECTTILGTMDAMMDATGMHRQAPRLQTATGPACTRCATTPGALPSCWTRCSSNPAPWKPVAMCSPACSTASSCRWCWTRRCTMHARADTVFGAVHRPGPFQAGQRHPRP